MKKQVTAEGICQRYKKVFTAGYCELQTLFPCHRAPYYHAQVDCGWNADYFTNENRSILFVTGYRPDLATGFSKNVVSLPRDFVRGFEDKASEIIRECQWTREKEREKRMISLREEFWRALDDYIEED